MSFSTEVKRELDVNETAARHCQIAELSAIISLSGHIEITEAEKYLLFVHTENMYVCDRFTRLVGLVTDERCEVSATLNMKKKSSMYTAVLPHSEAVKDILKAIKFMEPDGSDAPEFPLVSPTVILNSCCKKAFLRGAFLTTGSVGDPNKAYHFEIVCETEEKAAGIADIMCELGLKGKSAKRKNHYIAYLKEGDDIRDALGLMEAPRSVMEFENVRVLKDVRNSVNRQVNCETANLSKTVKASARELADIEYIRDTKGLLYLPKNLIEVAEARLANPDATLLELGRNLTKPLGKSGVNHRLQKIGEIAESLRGKENA